MKHLFFKRITVCFLGTVKFCAVKHTFSAAAGRTDVSAGIAADTFAQFFLEEFKSFLWRHCFDPFHFCKAVSIFCILGLTDDLIIDHMLFALTYMASFQHCIFIGNSFAAINCFNFKVLAIISKLCSGDFLDSLDSHFAKLFHIQLTFAAYTNNIGFFTVYPVLFNQLVKAVCVTRLQTDKGFSFQLGSFDHHLA